MTERTRTAGLNSDEMVCDRCHRRHGVVWFAPSDVWNMTMREGDRGNPDLHSFCCPICFMQLAEEAGVKTPAWLVTPFDDGPVVRAEQVVLRDSSSEVTVAADIGTLRLALTEILAAEGNARSFDGGCACGGMSGEGKKQSPSCKGHVPEVTKIARRALGLPELSDNPRVEVDAHV